MDVIRARPNESIAFWLIPAAPKKDLFDQLIKTLVRELKAPLFPSHLTLFTARLPLTEARRVLRDFESGPFSLTISQVSHSNQFSKTLFIRFRPSNALSRLTSRLQGRVEMKRQAVADPHLSLCYKNLPVAARRELAAIVRMPFKKVLFDRITLALCRPQTRSAADVKTWRTVSGVRLGD